MIAMSIITNPPYERAHDFISHALDLTQPISGRVAMLLPMAFDCAKTRRSIFAQHPAFCRKLVLTKRVRWANLEQKTAGPSMNHAWFVWDWRNEGSDPTIGYLHG
ncbi:MAG: hypothetical protein ACRD3W_22355 [Terriglobales bacterium]